MLARTPSTVRLIGAGLTSLGAAAALIFAPAGTTAQQLAATQDADRSAYLQTHCGHIRDADRQLGCIAVKSIEFSRAQTAVAKQQITEAESLQRCIAYLGEKRASGTVFDRKITRENVCPYARELGMRDGPG